MLSLQQIRDFELTPYLAKRQYEESLTTDWDRMFHDHQNPLNSFSGESFDVNPPAPHSSPCSTETSIDSQLELLLPFDFDDMVNWDYPQTFLSGSESVPIGSYTSPIFRGEKVADLSNYVSPGVVSTDSMSTQSDELDSAYLSFEGSPEGNEPKKDSLSSPLESPLSWSPDFHTPSQVAIGAKPFEPLSPEEEEASLAAIALATATQSSPADTGSPIPSPTRRKKRKASPNSELDCAPPCKHSKRAKINQHNLIEKRYRSRIIERIDSLRKVIPALQGMEGLIDSDEVSSQDGAPRALKVNKATILTTAIDYILELEKRAKGFSKVIQSQKLRIDAYGSLIVSPETADHFLKTDVNTGL